MVIWEGLIGLGKGESFMKGIGSGLLGLVRMVRLGFILVYGI